MFNRLTPEQQAAFEAAPVSVRLPPSGDQSPEQARNLAVDSFRAVCELDGIGVPSDAAVEAAIDAAVPAAGRGFVPVQPMARPPACLLRRRLGQ
jgi:hypothetical protein